jgi:hypothetical protein
MGHSRCRDERAEVHVAEVTTWSRSTRAYEPSSAFSVCWVVQKGEPRNKSAIAFPSRNKFEHDHANPGCSIGSPCTTSWKKKVQT